MRKAISIALLALTGCGPSVTRRQCEFIGTHGPIAVGKHFNWAGYYDCQGRKALVPVLVGNHMDLGVFDFKEKRVEQLLGPDDGGSTIGRGKRQWVLSPNGKFVIWVQVRLDGPGALIGPGIRIYHLESDKRFAVSLPERSSIGTFGAWQLEGFSQDGNEAIFDLHGRTEKAIVNLPKGTLVVKDN